MVNGVRGNTIYYKDTVMVLEGFYKYVGEEEGFEDGDFSLGAIVHVVPSKDRIDVLYEDHHFNHE